MGKEQVNAISGICVSADYIGLGQNDQAFKSLEQAFREHSDMLVYLKVDPRLDPIRSDS